MWAFAKTGEKVGDYMMTASLVDPIVLDKVRGWRPYVEAKLGGSCAAGAAQESGRYVINLDLLTPETATSTHCFWTPSRSFDVADDALTAQIPSMTATAFDQDKALIESQQRVLGHRELRDMRLAATKDEVGAARSRTIMRHLMAAALGASGASRAGAR